MTVKFMVQATDFARKYCSVAEEKAKNRNGRTRAKGQGPVFFVAVCFLPNRQQGELVKLLVGEGATEDLWDYKCRHNKI